MTTSFFDGRAVMHHGDSRDVLRTIPDASIDSVVCDPPYALVSIVKRFGGANAAPCQHGTDGAYARASAGFMGQAWDTGETAFAVAFWAEVLRVLKPGGHVVAFSGTRTYHRLAVAIEDAGFEIRDQLAWVYGTGFPKSHDVAKAIDRAAGATGAITPIGAPVKRMIPGADQDKTGSWLKESGRIYQPGDYAPATAAARQWTGWGTALKPAWEPIVLARKPLIGTVAETVLAHGTGAINIGACRVATDDVISTTRNVALGSASSGVFGAANVPGVYQQQEGGRFPANLMHDGSPEALAGFPETHARGGNPRDKRGTPGVCYGAGLAAGGDRVVHNDSGSAARFFYCSKASKRDRAGSKHPTVKPVALMRWLVRLVTPPGGTVLEPFAGSGTTLQAAIEEGASVIGIEREAQFFDDCCRRLEGTGGLPRERREADVEGRPESPEPAALPPPVRRPRNAPHVDQTAFDLGAVA